MSAAKDAASVDANLRDRLREAAGSEAGDLVWSTIKDALSVKKTCWVSCPSCKKRLPAEVRDAAAAVRAAQLLLENLSGKPGIASGEEQEQVIIQRVVCGRRHADELVPAVRPRAGAVDGNGDGVA